jgi:hypothetical protein
MHCLKYSAKSDLSTAIHQPSGLSQRSIQQKFAYCWCGHIIPWKQVDGLILPSLGITRFAPTFKQGETGSMYGEHLYWSSRTFLLDWLDTTVAQRAVWGVHDQIWRLLSAGFCAKSDYLLTFSGKFTDKNRQITNQNSERNVFYRWRTRKQ